MKITAQNAQLSGIISVPGSKSHTIRACLFASLADGTSYIRNPLPSADCLSAARAVREIGAEVKTDGDVWVVKGAGKNAHLPSNIVDVGNSGSVLYFLSPICATFPGWSIFTGDASIRTRPVSHLVSALTQLGGEAYISRPDCDAPPFLVRGPVSAGKIVTDGRLSQYISGIMIAAALLKGKTEIELTDPKEVPYLKMTKTWLASVGIPVEISDDYRFISVSGPHSFPAIDRTVPSDWEAVAFPLAAAIMTDSELVIDKIDFTGSQGDDAIVEILRAVGADIEEDKNALTLTVRGGKKSRINNPEKGHVNGRLAGSQRVNCAGFPDAVPTLAAAACFTEGTTVLEDIAVCRRKETDRIAVMKSELTKLGADIEEGPDYLIIRGHSPLTADGEPNPQFAMHGGEVESYDDHRVAMALAVLGLALPKGSGQTVIVKDAECCAVSFPEFFDKMNTVGAGFIKL